MRTPDSQSFEETYRGLTDGELLQLAASVDSLTDAAQAALGVELRARNLEPAPQANSEVIPEPCLPEESAPARCEARRSAGTTTAGVILLVFSAALLALTISTFLVLRRRWFPQQLWQLEPSRVRHLINFESQAVLAGWGIATAVGILRLRSWARVSGLLICSLSAYVCSGVVLGGLATLPSMLQRFGAKMTESSTGLVLMYFGIAGVGVLGAIFLASETTEQQFRGCGPISSNSRSTAVICIGIWLVAAWPLTLFLTVVNVHPPLLMLPSVPFAWVLSGWQGTAYQILVACAAVALGVGLLRMRPWARTYVLALCAVVLLSALIVTMRQNITAVGAVVKGLSVSRLGFTVLSLWDASPAAMAVWLLLKSRPSELHPTNGRLLHTA